MTVPVDETPTPAPTPPRTRLLSLDAFRGLTIAGMILVNNPGSWSNVYPPLRHAEWDGWTPTDLVFPFFLFIMGVAVPLALGSRRERGAGIFGILVKVLWRSVAIFALGLALNGFPEYQLDTLRILGVLQRIAICYLFASIFFLSFGPKMLTASIILLLGGYTAAMLLIPTPDGPAGDLSRAGNLAAYIDRLVLSTHTYRPEYDPEGLLSTIPALATSLIGVLAGRWLRSGRDGHEICASLLASGVILTLLGYATSAGFPINKALWSAPFVLLTGGLALLGFGAFYWAIDLKGYRRWCVPLVVFGLNPIAAYVLSGLTGRLMALIRLSSPTGEPMALKTWIVEVALARVADPINASLLFGLGYVLFWLLVMSIFYRYKVVIRL